MRHIKNIALALALCMGTSAYAQDCEVQIAAVVDNNLGEIPAASVSQIESALTRLANANGVSKDITYAQFVLTAKIDVLDKHIVAGPPQQIVNNLGVTLYIVDAINRQKYANTYMEVNGVGKSEIKSYNNALSNLKPQNAAIVSFIDKAKKKIMDYYDRQYPNIIKEAEKKASLQQYEEAVALCVSVPSCSKGGNAAMKAGLKIYTKYRNLINEKILVQAKAVWAADQSPEAAAKVAELLAAIDPESSSYGQATTFMNEVKKQTRSDIDFEMREKYHDEVDIQKQTISALREVGVAFGRGQKAQTTNLMWLR